MKSAVVPLYKGSKWYKHTICEHALRVAGLSKSFAEQMGGNPFVAEMGGLLHDIGAALHGKKDHHITGVREAIPILISCGCPQDLIGDIVVPIYSHRGSQQIPLQTQESWYVAAADAGDHYSNLGEVWVAYTSDLAMTPLEAFRAISEKLERDWEKTHPKIRVMLNGAYEQAKRELVRISERAK